MRSWLLLHLGLLCTSCIYLLVSPIMRVAIIHPTVRLLSALVVKCSAEEVTTVLPFFPSKYPISLHVLPLTYPFAMHPLAKKAEQLAISSIPLFSAQLQLFF